MTAEKPTKARSEDHVVAMSLARMQEKSWWKPE